MNTYQLYFCLLCILKDVSSFDPSVAYKACLGKGENVDNCIKQ